jgi:hypothetical protein
MGPLARTFDTYNDVDDLHFAGAHDVIKRRKLGYGKATDDACREIRYGRLTRQEGLALAQTCEGRLASDFQALAKFIDMAERQITALVDRHVNANAGPAAQAAQGAGSAAPKLPDACLFRTNTPEDFEGDPRARQLLTRGYARERDVVN